MSNSRQRRSPRGLAKAPRKRQSGRPVGSNGIETRRAIREGALGAFATHGYEGMSVRDLARELGVSHNLIHHHYGSKQDLWRAALEHGCAPSARELVSLVEFSNRDSDWEAAIRESVTGAITLLARHPEVTAILVSESARGGPRLDFPSPGPSPRRAGRRSDGAHRSACGTAVPLLAHDGALPARRARDHTGRAGPDLRAGPRPLCRVGDQK